MKTCFTNIHDGTRFFKNAAEFFPQAFEEPNIHECSIGAGTCHGSCCTPQLRRDYTEDEILQAQLAMRRNESVRASQESSKLFWTTHQSTRDTVARVLAQRK